ncbi:MAG: DUF58 domain-containing protein [Planctomycetota bacterium]
MNRVSVEHLTDPAFLASLQPLRIVARRVVRGGRHAEHLSRQRGSGLEFADYRAYTPGDDLRAIDWNIYRRLGRVFVRLFEEQQDLPLYVLPDVSSSLHFEPDSPRARACLQTTLAIASVSLNQHDRVGIFPFAEELRVHEAPTSGKNRVLPIARRLAEVEFKDQTDLCSALRRFGAMNLRQGLCVVVSDFFDQKGADAIVEQLGQLRHRLLLVQLFRKEDRDPDLQGDLRLVDSETGEAENVSVTPELLQRMQTAYDQHQQALVDFARTRSAGFLRIDVDQPIVPQLAQVFEEGALQV